MLGRYTFTLPDLLHCSSSMAQGIGDRIGP
jgi:hypothetical protein